MADHDTIRDALVAALYEANRVVRTEREQAEREGTSDALEDAEALRAVEEQAEAALKLAGAG